MIEPRHEVLEHVGELELRLCAPSFAALLREAGVALAAELLRGQAGEPVAETVPIELEGADPAALLVDWLNELVYRADADGVVLTAFDFGRADEGGVSCQARGVRAVIAVPVKAATFHGLTVAAVEGGLEARVILDI